jgi:hypothetical protein
MALNPDSGSLESVAQYNGLYSIRMDIRHQVDEIPEAMIRLFGLWPLKPTAREIQAAGNGLLP